MTSLKIGTRLDQYEVLAALGSGAMGEVYQAKDLRLDRIVALKIITATRGLDPDARDRFDREARALAALSHPHICNVYHYGEDEGTPYLVMEYLRGQTVAQRLRTEGKLPPADVMRYGVQIAEALHAAHQAGIVHRDLKPENVMLTDGGAKLLDLGVSKRLPQTEERWYHGTTQLALSGVGTISGTVPYMAPEQLEGHPANVRSDIFSLGAVLYEMATGRRAFEGQSQARIIASIMSQEPVRASSLEPALPRDLDGVLERCLKKIADARYQSGLEVAEALRGIRDGDVSRPLLPAAVVDTVVDAPAPPRKRRRLVIRFSIGISFGVIVLAVGARMLLLRQESAGDRIAIVATNQPPVTSSVPETAPVSNMPPPPRVEPAAPRSAARSSPPPPPLPATSATGSSQVAPAATAAPPSVPPAPATGAVPTPPVPAAGAPMVDQPTAAISGRLLAEMADRKEIVALADRYCAAYETLDAERIRQLIPFAAMSLLRSQLEPYKSLKCTVMSPPIFLRFDGNEPGSATITFKIRQVAEMKADGRPQTSDIGVTMSVSRRERGTQWQIVRIEHQPVEAR